MLLSKTVYDTSKINHNIGIQKVYTPLAEIETATGFSFINSVPAECKEICVLFNPEFIEYFLNQDYIKNNGIKLVFCFDSEFDQKWVKRMERFYKYNNVDYIDITKFSDTKDIGDLIKSMGQRKFDVVFSNPPYGTKGNNLDLKILKNCFNYSKNIVFIHPAGYILDNKFKTKLYNEIRNTNYLESINLFWGNKMFDILLLMPLCISQWNMNKKDSMCKVNDSAFINWTHNNSQYNCKINDICMHAGNHEAINFKNFIITYMNTHYKSIQDNLTPHGMLTDISIRFPLIRGGNEYGKGIYSHFYSLIGLDYDALKCDHTFEFSQASRDHGCEQLHWAFNNENERENFIQYCKSKVARFCLSFYKNNAHLDGTLNIIPWLDFTQSWNDAKLCKEFNISKELWNYIDKFIPNYYDDYKSGF